MASSERIGVNNTKRANYKLNSTHVTTMDYMRLQPVYCEEMVPGDTFRVNVSGFVRLAPLSSPVFGRARIDYHAFFVPNRILWNDWEAYIDGESQNTVPYIQLGAHANKWIDIETENELTRAKKHDIRCILSGLGYPTNANGQETGNLQRFSAFPIRAYQRIWWDWYRNSEKVLEYEERSYIRKESGDIYTSANFEALVGAKYRTWDKDYITSAFSRPSQSAVGGGIKRSDNLNSTQATMQGAMPYRTAPASGVTTGETAGGIVVGNNTTTSIQAIRWANALQRWMETNNVAGSRYLGRMLARYGVTPNPKTLQMSEFIGYISEDITISDVTQTENANDGGAGIAFDNAFGIQSDNEQGTIRGSYAGKGWNNNRGEFTYNAQEHGFLIIIGSVVPDVIYENAVPRYLQRGMINMPNGRFDWWTPEMENVGFQPIYAYEVGIPNGNQTTDPDEESYEPMSVYGYTPRYEEYKHALSKCSGDFVEPKFYQTMRNFVLSRNIIEATEAYDGQSIDMERITTESGYAFTLNDKKNYDDKFNIRTPWMDHFALQFNVSCNASRPMNDNSMPQLEDNNVAQHDVPRGGVSL